MTSRCIVAFAWCALCALAAAAAPSAAAASSASPPGAVCRPLAGAFDFARRPPSPSPDLAFCKEFRASTCCDKAHSLAVLRSLAPYFATDDVGDSFSDACRQISSQVLCAPCHPHVGTGRKVGICPDLCDQWYSSCRAGLYTHADGLLLPCTDNELVCAPLDAIVSGGREMCERTGMGAGKIRADVEQMTDKERIEAFIRQHSLDSSAASSEPSDSGDAAAAGAAVDSDDVGCFDGRIPSSASFSSSDARSAAEETRKRYYKTPAELEEINRRRRAREEAAAARNGIMQTAERTMRQVSGWVQRSMRPLTRQWARLVGSLPLPPFAKRTLEGPFVLGLLLLLLQLLLWTIWNAGVARACARWRRMRQRATGLEHSSGLSASGLTGEEVRRLRAEKLLQQQYAATAAAVPPIDFAKYRAPLQQQPGMYTTIIDGEVVTLPE